MTPRALVKTFIALILLAAAQAQESSPLLERDASHGFDAPEPGSYELPRIKQASGGIVMDSSGKSLDLAKLTRGKVTVLSFIYSRCADARACPHATGILNELHRISSGDGELAEGMRLISMSFDPLHDTPERMASYAKLTEDRKPGAQWHFLTTTSEKDLKPILEGYGQSVSRKADPGSPTGPLNHNLRVLLIDRQGFVRNIYSSGTFDLRLVLADIRTLLMETKGKES